MEKSRLTFRDTTAALAGINPLHPSNRTSRPSSRMSGEGQKTTSKTLLGTSALGFSRIRRFLHSHSLNTLLECRETSQDNMIYRRQPYI